MKILTVVPFIADYLRKGNTYITYLSTIASVNVNGDFIPSLVIRAVSESNHRLIMGRITVACDGQEVSRKTYLSASPYPLFPLTVPLSFVESF